MLREAKKGSVSAAALYMKLDHGWIEPKQKIEISNPVDKSLEDFKRLSKEEKIKKLKILWDRIQKNTGEKSTDS